MSLQEAVTEALVSPSASAVWRLRAELLAAGLPPESGVWEILEEFHRFLDDLETGASSRHYSQLASKLDISAVGGVLLEHVLDPKAADELAQRLMTGLLSEGLMVLATRQHIKAWEGELGAVYRSAAWWLYGEMWRWSERRSPEVHSPERRLLLDRLFAPVHSREASGFSKAVLLGLLFQVLLLGALARELPRLPSAGR